MGEALRGIAGMSLRSGALQCEALRGNEVLCSDGPCVALLCTAKQGFIYDQVAAL